MENCIFCKIVKGEIPSHKVYEDEEILAFRDIEPEAPTHVLIIPKIHIENLSQASEENKDLLGKILLVAKKISESEKINDAFKLTINNGKFAGQIVMHMHFHLLGGWTKKEDVKSGLHLVK